MSEYRIKWQVLKRNDVQSDFEEVGDGASAVTGTLAEAANGAVSLLQSLTNEQGERADLPSELE